MLARGAIALAAWATGAATGAATSTAKATGADARASAAAVDALPASVRAALGAPRLAGAGSLRWFGFRIYDATLWTGPEGPDPLDPARRPLALELRYARSLSGAAIAERSAEEIERLGLGDAEARQAWHRRMQQLFPDVSDGDRILGLHRPGQAARFYLNGSPLGEVADPGFGPAFFAIWFDARTVAPDLRQALLGPAAPR
jgi:hypothetical protein